MNLAKRLFSAEGATGETLDVIRWWELRRIPYNILVGLTGLISCGVMVLILIGFVQPDTDIGDPLPAFVLGTLLFGAGANFFYALGWILELRAVGREDRDQHRIFREKNFRDGLILSCALATTPIWFALLAWVISRIF